MQAKPTSARYGPKNQDTWRAGRRADGTGWALVCDGMGGARAGGLASRTAAGSMEQQLWEAAPREAENGGAVLAEAVSQANLAVYQRAQEGGSSTYGMGTTIAAVLVRGRDVFYAHVGDSRIYLCRGGILVQLTRDHSRVQEMVEAGVITQQQAKVHPKRNQIHPGAGGGYRRCRWTWAASRCSRGTACCSAAMVSATSSPSSS